MTEEMRLVNANNIPLGKFVNPDTEWKMGWNEELDAAASQEPTVAAVKMEQYNELKEENEVLRRRLQHLLQSETVRMYDEIDPRTRKYRRDIRYLDAIAGSTEGGLRCEKDMTIQEAIRRIRQHISVHHIGQPPHYYIGKALDMAIEALQEKALREKKKKPGVIKTDKNVEFDVVYDDGTQRHVTEGVLFEVENERIVFHNGTDRPEVIYATAEAAAEVVGNMNLPIHQLEVVIDRVLQKFDGSEG